MKRFAAVLAGMAWDLVILAGGAAIAWGVGLIYPPAGIITAGALTLAAGVLGAMAAPDGADDGKDGGGG